MVWDEFFRSANQGNAAVWQAYLYTLEDPYLLKYEGTPTIEVAVYSPSFTYYVLFNRRY